MNSQTLFGACLCLLLVATSAESWQSYGNFSDSNISIIRSTLQTAIADFQATPLYASAKMRVSANISNTLNTQWSPAWNVVFFYHNEGVDKVKSIVYGYAFNNHWLWYNDYTPKTSVIIWKDYNCDKWADVNGGDGGLTQTIKDEISTYADSIISQNPIIFDDSWLFGYKIVSALETAHPTHAYSIIVVASVSTIQFIGKVCIVSNAGGEQQYAINTKSSITGIKKLSYLVLRMR